MKALVTGATGFLGRPVVEELLACGVHVRCFLRDSSRADGLPTSDRLEVVRGHLNRPEACTRAVAGCDTVFHIAAEMKGATAVLFQANVVATRTLVAEAMRVGVKRFVLVSSFGVYGTAGVRTGGALDETCPIDPTPHLRDPYSYSKAEQEQVCWEAHRTAGLPLVVVRPGVIYGPGRDCLTGRVGIKLGNFMMVMGGRQPMPYTHVANCARGVVLAGSVPGVEGQAFNLVDDELPTGKQLVRRYKSQVQRLRSLSVPEWAVPTLSGACEWYHRFSRGQLPAVLTRYKSQAQWRTMRYPNAKAKRVLGWNPEVGLEQGLRETFDWLKANHRTGRDRS